MGKCLHTVLIAEINRIIDSKLGQCNRFMQHKDRCLKELKGFQTYSKAKGNENKKVTENKAKLADKSKQMQKQSKGKAKLNSKLLKNSYCFLN